MFATRLQLRHVVNTVAAENPQWGQLGCNGFIIVDRNGKVICDKTLPFMEYREAAFEYLLDMLDVVLATPGSTEKIAKRLQSMPTVKQETNCNSGGCSSGTCSLPKKRKCNDPDGKCSLEKDSGQKSSEEAVSELAKIVSVHHAELDRQHHLCADALEQLRLKCDVSSLRQVLDCYKMHFEYEENLLDTHLYKEFSDEVKEETQSNGFSAAKDARKSHYRDHKRLIGDIQSMVTHLESDGNGKEMISKKFVSDVLRNFERHANVYDDSYADALSAAMQ